MTKSEINAILREKVALVTFTKTNGEERIMKATLIDQYLPVQIDVEEYVARNKNDEVVACWDVEKEGWRSFRVDSVKDISIV
jgi:hypothetical protein